MIDLTRAQRLTLIDGAIAVIRGKIEAYKACDDLSIILAWPQYGFGVRLSGEHGHGVVDVLQADALPEGFKKRITNGKGEPAERCERRYAAWAATRQAEASLACLYAARADLIAE